MYPILGSVYMLIAFALLMGGFRNEPNTLGLTGHVILFGMAAIMSLTYSVWGIVLGVRERRRQARENDGPA